MLKTAGRRQEWRRGTHECVRHDGLGPIAARDLQRAREPFYCAVTVICAAALATPPTVTTTGCTPSGVFAPAFTFT